MVLQMASSKLGITRPAKIEHGVWSFFVNMGSREHGVWSFFVPFRNNGGYVEPVFSLFWKSQKGRPDPDPADPDPADRYTPESLDNLKFICLLFPGDIEQQRSLSSRYFKAQRKKLLELSQRLDPLPAFRTRLNALSQRLHQTRLISRHETRLWYMASRLNKMFESRFPTREAADSVFRRNQGAAVSQLPLVKYRLEQRLREFDGVILEPDTPGRIGGQCIKCGHKFWTKVAPSKSRCPECFTARVIPCQMVSSYRKGPIKLSPLVT
jgi:hypothetical protein